MAWTLSSADYTIVRRFSRCAHGRLRKDTMFDQRFDAGITDQVLVISVIRGRRSQIACFKTSD